MSGFPIWIFILIALVAANLPWLTDRLFGLIPVSGEQVKAIWLRLVEWLVFYILIAAFALGLEYKQTGGIHPQDWEIFAVTFCLFLVFALPGFIYYLEFKRKKLN